MYDPELLKKLGLDESASMDDIEEAYDLIIKRTVAKNRAGSLNEEEKRELDACTDAYNTLTGRELSKRADGKEVGDWNQGLNKRTIRNFFYIFKLPIIIISAFIIIAGFFVHDILTKPVYDLSVCTFRGVVFNEEKLDGQLKQAIPGVDKIGFQGNEILTDEAFVAKYMVGTFDIVIMNRTLFERYAEQGYFASLDEVANRHKISKEMIDYGTLKVVDETDSHLYGIDASRCAVLDGVVGGEGVMIAISNSSLRKEQAEKYIDYLMSNIK